MRFYFIRHAQSANNQLYATNGARTGRSDDPELTELGKRQAEILARFLREDDLGITNLYTSLMARAVATGAIVADALGLQLTAWVDLHETGGIYLEDPETGEKVGQAGKNRAYFETHYPKLILPNALGDAGWWNYRPFEERDQRPARAERCLNDLLARHGGTEHCVAVISHGGFFTQLIAAILKMDHRFGYWFGCYNAAISRIDFDAEMIELAYLNRIDFMPREMVTC